MVIKSQVHPGNTKHRRSQRLRNASACHPEMTRNVVPAVTVKLVILRAAGSEFHFSLVEMSGSFSGLGVFCNGILNISNTVPVPQPGQVLKLASCSSFNFCACS